MTSAPIGTPPASPLASVTASGTTSVAWWASQWPVRPIPRLDLVEDEERAGVAGQVAGQPQVCVGGGHDAGLALDRLEDDGREVVAGVGHRRPQRVLVVVGDVGDAGHQRLERRAVGLLPRQREGAGGAAVEGVLGRR